MQYIVSINGKNYEVEIERGQASIIGITESAVQVVQTVVAVPIQTNAAQSNITGEVIKAPMPGIILAVKTKLGSPVKKGNVLFIMEAMKMENEIVAPKDGIVSHISVVSGASVTTGDVLGVI